jgi:hypothetical protein
MKHEPLFDKLYGAKEELLKILKMPLARKQLKRKFETAYDDTVIKIEEAENKIHACHEKCHEMDINDLLRAKQAIEQATKLQEYLKDEYEILFAKPMKVTDDED